MFAQARLLERAHQVAGGLKALAALGISAGLALADYYDAVPIAPVVQHVLGEDAASKVMLFAPLLFGTLRYVSTNQIFVHHVDKGE